MDNEALGGCLAIIIGLLFGLACWVGGLALLCWIVVTILRHLGVHI
jgi:hypothetical protein